MEPETTHAAATSAVELLNSASHFIVQLEADLQRQQQEIAQLRQERDVYRRVLVEHFKLEGADPKDWDHFDEKDYTLTVDDLLSVIKAS